MSIRNDDTTKKTWVQGINKRSSHIARKKRTTGKHLAIKGKLEGTMKKDDPMPRPLHMVTAHWSIRKFLPTLLLNAPRDQTHQQSVLLLSRAELL